MRKFKITYVKTKMIVIDETTLEIEAEDANTAVVDGYERLGWDDWDLSNFKDITDSGGLND